MNELQKAVLKTLAYADVFAYPLTLEEIHLFLITPSGKAYFLKEIEKELTSSELHFLIESQKNYFFLKNRQEIISLRQERDFYSSQKLKIAKRAAGWLKLIPFIKMVGITGNLAMKNADEDDDIDLLIITGQKRLWLTRLLTIFLTELVSKRRRPEDKEVKDKICLNMFLDEEHLTLPQNEQNLFTAHEIYQLKILWQKENIYQKFLKENQWCKKFLPNWKV
jgi:hypothetical protein